MARGPGNLDRTVTRWFQDGDHRLGITHDSSSHRDLADLAWREVGLP